jgi:hypothetical protein
VNILKVFDIFVTLAGIFNYHYICTVCGLEVCPNCFTNLYSTDQICSIDNLQRTASEFKLFSKFSKMAMSFLIRNIAPLIGLDDTDGDSEELGQENAHNKSQPSRFTYGNFFFEKHKYYY